MTFLSSHIFCNEVPWGTPANRCSHWVCTTCQELSTALPTQHCLATLRVRYYLYFISCGKQASEKLGGVARCTEKNVLRLQPRSVCLHHAHVAISNHFHVLKSTSSIVERPVDTECHLYSGALGVRLLGCEFRFCHVRAGASYSTSLSSFVRWGHRGHLPHGVHLRTTEANTQSRRLTHTHSCSGQWFPCNLLPRLLLPTAVQMWIILFSLFSFPIS